MTTKQRISEAEEEFRTQFDTLGLKPPKNSMKNLERELIIDYWRKFYATLINEAVEEAWEEAVRLSDEIEMAEPDGGTRQWIAFKRFRNTLRDYIEALNKNHDK